MPRRTSFDASARECAASASSAADPDINPLISFAMAMTTFAASAMMIVRQLSFLSILFSAARDRRFVGRSMNASLVQLASTTGGARSRWNDRDFRRREPAFGPGEQFERGEIC